MLERIHNVYFWGLLLLLDYKNTYVFVFADSRIFMIMGHEQGPSRKWYGLYSVTFHPKMPSQTRVYVF